jgi:hypothetical protein
MQEEGASHSAGRSEMDEENLNGAGIDEAEIEESEGSVQGEDSQQEASEMNLEIGEDSLDAGKPSLSKSLNQEDLGAKTQKKRISKNSKPKRKKDTNRSEKPHRMEKLRDQIPKKLLLDDHNSKTRREYKNYDEMLACLNLLKYMDWDKIDPKTHKNSPCRFC